MATLDHMRLIAARRLLVNIPHMSSGSDVASPPSSQSSGSAYSSPTAEHMRPGSPVYTPTAFDTNIVIITAALLVVLICALGMNTLIKCALNWTRRVAMESQAQEDDVSRRRGNSTGIKKTELRLFPTAVYCNELIGADEKVKCHGGTGGGGGGAGAHAYAGRPTQESQCPICLNEFRDGERIRVLPVCNHGFHIKCVDTWLYNHASCPICRGDLSHANNKTTTTSNATAAETPPPPPPAAAAAAQVQLQIVFTPAGGHATPTTLFKVVTPPCPAGHDDDQRLIPEGSNIQTHQTPTQ